MPNACCKQSILSPEVPWKMDRITNKPSSVRLKQAILISDDNHIREKRFSFSFNAEYSPVYHGFASFAPSWRVAVFPGKTYILYCKSTKCITNHGFLGVLFNRMPTIDALHRSRSNTFQVQKFGEVAGGKVS